MKCNYLVRSCWCKGEACECNFGGPCPHQVPDALAADPVFNCPPFCTKCGRCHNLGPCPPAAPRRIGQHWLEVAAERVRAGEGEATVMRDYGYYTDYR